MPNIIEELQSIAASLEDSPEPSYNDFELVDDSFIADEFNSILKTVNPFILELLK